MEGENLEELFQKFADAGETWNTESDLIDKMSRTAGIQKFVCFLVEIVVISDVIHNYTIAW